jgi:phenylpyruvate tautomerase PptA (4-oxalocrotonate tautomerase family)
MMHWARRKWCLIEEVDLEGWGDGGKPVTPEMLKQH